MNVAMTTERVDALIPMEGGRADRAQASFAAALRDLEQSAGAMLAMPHVAARPQEPPPAQRESGPAAREFVSGPAAADRGRAASRESVRTSRDVPPAGREPGHWRTIAASGVAATVEAAGASHVRASERLSAAAPAIVPAVCVDPTTAAGTTADSSCAMPNALVGERLHALQFAGQTGQQAAPVPAQLAARIEPAAAASVSSSAAARFAPAPEARTASAALGPAQVITCLAPDGVAVAVRAALLGPDIERELLVRLAAELGASGIGRYSIQLNGICVAGSTEKGGK